MLELAVRSRVICPQPTLDMSKSRRNHCSKKADKTRIAPRKPSVSSCWTLLSFALRIIPFLLSLPYFESTASSSSTDQLFPELPLTPILSLIEGSQEPSLPLGMSVVLLCHTLSHSQDGVTEVPNLPTKLKVT